eukprot:6213430-Pleurochrysis_carterae.AAC.6
MIGELQHEGDKLGKRACSLSLYLREGAETGPLRYRSVARACPGLLPRFSSHCMQWRERCA